MFHELIDDLDGLHTFFAWGSCNCEEDSLQDYEDEIEEALKTYEIEEDEDEIT